MTPATTAVARAPMRISLAGGGTDVESFASRHGGLVVALAVDRYVTVTVTPGAAPEDASDLHGRAEPAGLASLREQLFRHALRRTGTRWPVHVGVVSDVPSGTGLGGSGAYTVALVHALRLAGPGAVGRRVTAELATTLETDDLGRPVGRQDHYMAALGGLQALHIGTDGSVRAEPLPVDDAVRTFVRERLLLFYTGTQRDAGAVLAPQSDRTARAEPGVLRTLTGIRDLAVVLREELMSGRTSSVADALNEHWALKCGLGGAVAPDRVVEAVAAARGAGAEGAKLLGAGGGGFVVVAVRPSGRDCVREALRARGMVELPFALAEDGVHGTTLGGS